MLIKCVKVIISNESKQLEKHPIKKVNYSRKKKYCKGSNKASTVTIPTLDCKLCIIRSIADAIVEMFRLLFVVYTLFFLSKCFIYVDTYRYGFYFLHIFFMLLFSFVTVWWSGASQLCNQFLETRWFSFTRCGLLCAKKIKWQKMSTS